MSPNLDEEQVPPDLDQAMAATPQIAPPPVPAPAQPQAAPSQMPSFLNISPEQLAAQEDDAQSRKGNIAMGAGIANALGNQHSFGEYFLGHVNPDKDYSPAFNAMSQAIVDPIQRQKMLLDAYQQQVGSKLQMAQMDPNSELSKTTRQNYKNLLQSVSPGLAAGISDNLSAAQLKDQLPFVDKLLTNQSAMNVVNQQGKNSKDVANINQAGELNKLMAEYALKNAYGLPVSPEDQKTLSSLDKAISSVQAVKDFVNKNPNSFGPAGGLLTSLPGNATGTSFGALQKMAAAATSEGMDNGTLPRGMYQDIVNSQPSRLLPVGGIQAFYQTQLGRLQADKAQKLSTLAARNQDLRGQTNYVVPSSGGSSAFSAPPSQSQPGSASNVPNANAASLPPPAAGKIRVTNGAKHFDIQPQDLQNAMASGYQPVR